MSALNFAPGDLVRHVDGREGVVIRRNETSNTVTVRFPRHHRASVVHASFLTLIAAVSS